MKRSRIILLSLLLSLPLRPQCDALRMKDVIIEGNQKVNQQKIMLLLKSRPGAEFSDDTVREDIRRLARGLVAIPLSCLGAE